MELYLIVCSILVLMIIHASAFRPSLVGGKYRRGCVSQRARTFPAPDGQEAENTIPEVDPPEAGGAVWDGESVYEVGKEGLVKKEEAEIGEMLKELLDAANLNFFQFKKKSSNEHYQTAYDDYEEFGSDNVKVGLQYYRQHAKAGMKCFMEHNIDGAINEFDKAILANSSQPLVQRGIALYLMGRYEDAIEQLRKDVELTENKNVRAVAEAEHAWGGNFIPTWSVLGCGQ